MIHVTPNPHRLVERLLAIVLAFAACLKAEDLLTGAIHHDVFPFDRRYLVWLLIALEFLLAFWLTIGGLERKRFHCAVACFALFAVCAFFESTRSDSSCGCFGRLKVAPAITGIFDLSSVLALWLTRPRWSRLLRATPVILLAIAAFSYVHFHRQRETQANDEPVVLEPASWINQTFPLFNSIDGAAEIKTGRWLLVLYHFDCDECRQAIVIYRAIAEVTRGQIDRPRLAFIAIPPFAPDREDPGHATADTQHFALTSDRDWIATTPVVVSLLDGRVLAATDGEQAAKPPGVLQRP
jgi:hypothetical protein